MPKTRRVNGQVGMSKRACNACARCREQKIKCSGSQPCEACKKRKLSCRFNERDQRILVTKGYITDLQQQIASRQRDVTANRATLGTSDTARADAEASATENDASLSSVIVSDVIDGAPTLASDANIRFAGEDLTAASTNCGFEQEDQRSTRLSKLDPVASNLINPLSAGPSKFMTSGEGRTYYLGTSSNWSFSRRVLSLAHEYVHRCPVATDSLLFDSAVYDLDWDGSRVTPGLDAPILPSLDHAIYLINAVKFHCAPMFHLFDEESFMNAMYDIYSRPTPSVAAAELSYIHLLLVLAFGKALVEKNTSPNLRRLPGSNFFVKALQLLPDIHVLSKDPVLSTEVLCCVALYLQCLDFRHAAYSSIGQAIRVALAYGMHTNMPVQYLGERLVERCRHIWWTIYIMDREMTSLMGLPQSLHDDDIQTELPTFLGSPQRSAALGMQIRLSRTIATVNRGVYGANGRLNKKFLIRVKEVLGSIAGLADELGQMFPMQPDKITINGVPRMSAYLHLAYHQCIVLATRPLLLCFLQIRCESPGSYLDAFNSSKTVQNLIKMCMDSSQQMVSILVCLQNQGLLEIFLPFDLDSLFVSTLNLLLGQALDPHLLENSYSWVEKSFEIVSEIAKSGNLIADHRRSELRQLDGLLRRFPSHFPQQPLNAADSSQQSQGAVLTSGEMLADESLAFRREQGNTLPSPEMDIPEFGNLDWELSTAQILDMANSIASSDTEWMQYAVMEHCIW